MHTVVKMGSKVLPWAVKHVDIGHCHFKYFQCLLPQFPALFRPWRIRKIIQGPVGTLKSAIGFSTGVFSGLVALFYNSVRRKQTDITEFAQMVCPMVGKSKRNVLINHKGIHLACTEQGIQLAYVWPTLSRVQLACAWSALCRLNSACYLHVILAPLMLIVIIQGNSTIASFRAAVTDGNMHAFSQFKLSPNTQ